MSTPEEPPQLTRKQLRELRNTAANQIITGPPSSTPEVEPAPVVAPLPRAAEPVALPEPPVVERPADASAPALTRREVRQRERLRTASVPVITADVLAASAAEAAAAASDAPYPAREVAESAAEQDETAVAEPVQEAVAEEATAEEATAEEVVAEEATAEEVVAEPAETASEQTVTEDAEAGEPEAASERATTASEPADRRVVGAGLGAELLYGQASAEVDIPASFDQLLTRGSTATGALSMPNALILSQTPDSSSLVSPVTATGEILITGTFSLPDTYGSTGTVPGSADGKDVDAVLVDGELPPASSPTPIAASAAISTIKSADEIIKPPAPEKGSKLMVVLAITAGVLAVGLLGVLILAMTRGVF